MPPCGIVEALDVIEHVSFGLVSCAVRFGRRAFGLQRREETLHGRIVPDVAGPAHATGDAVVGQEPLEGLTGVLAAPIGEMKEMGSLLDFAPHRAAPTLRAHGPPTPP